MTVESRYVYSMEKSVENCLDCKAGDPPMQIMLEWACIKRGRREGYCNWCCSGGVYEPRA